MRRYKFALFLVLISVLLVSCSKNEVENRILDVETVSWPIYRGDSMLSGMAADELPEQLSLLWSFKTESWIISSPVIGFGRVFTPGWGHLRWKSERRVLFP
jgi:hypothetical protein